MLSHINYAGDILWCTMTYYGVCHCLYQYHTVFYHVGCDKHHDQNSFTMVITFIITTT